MNNTAPSIDTARAAWSSQRRDDNASRRAAVHAIHRSGITTLGGIAEALQAQGIRTPSGGEKWHRAQVARLLAVPKPDTRPEPPPELPKPSSVALVVSPLLSAVTGAASERSAMVRIVVTVDHVYLPLDGAGNARPDWKTAADTVKVAKGTCLQAPEDLAAFLSADGREQAERIGAPRRL